MICGLETQKRLHKIFRHKIREWKKSELIKGVVLTYHFKESKETDSLHVCLDIPAVKKLRKGSIQLPHETIKQIPSEIMSKMEQNSSQKQIMLEIRDYELEIERDKVKNQSQGIPYYREAPVEEILRFASIGTEIALQILDFQETGKQHWASEKDLVSFILLRLRKELGESYFWLPEAFHFVWNPLLRG